MTINAAMLRPVCVVGEAGGAAGSINAASNERAVCLTAVLAAICASLSDIRLRPHRQYYLDPDFNASRRLKFKSLPKVGEHKQNERKS